MAEPALAYRMSGETELKEQGYYEEQPQLRIYRRNDTLPDEEAALVPRSVKITLVVAVLILASIPFIRIWFANDTMRMLVTSKSIEQEISTNRAEGHRLESRYSAMTNPQTIQRQAEELGMVPDPDPVYLWGLSEDEGPGSIDASQEASDTQSSDLSAALEIGLLIAQVPDQADDQTIGTSQDDQPPAGF
ncbi:MAG: hypothetical protein FWH40_07235 [Coriobacteriia bacterium]|nr:hypothetical protein [Coriobacteriia bacterium]